VNYEHWYLSAIFTGVKYLYSLILRGIKILKFSFSEDLKLMQSNQLRMQAKNTENTITSGVSLGWVKSHLYIMPGVRNEVN
jgi:hypothetical protein